ncbi:MAG: LuxR C-terminal-related transcriptional regulator [Solirubrobacteraceae bacterium]
MSVLGARAAAVRETIAELSDQPPTPQDLVEEVAERVRKVVPYDVGAWMTTDPATLLPTAIAAVNSSPAQHVAYSRAELIEAPDDFNSYQEMMRLGQAAAALSLATGGDLEQSHRYRQVHVPFGQGDELRMVARDAGSAWAIACVSRADDVPNFTAEEVRYVASIAEHVGAGIRKALTRRPSDEPTVRSPGMLVLSQTLDVEASTGEADRWLGKLTPTFPGTLPGPITVVAMQALANAERQAPVRPARLRMQVPGGWLLIHADVLKDPSGGADRVAVVLEPADRAELVPLLLALHGLSGREREVAELLVAGLGTDEIAARLHISRHTVRDHVKSIFAKVGVTSRPELTAVLAQEPLAA